MEKKKKKYTHKTFKDEHGKDFLCPVEKVKGGRDAAIDFNVCFEKNVPGRYAARINIRES